MVKLIQDGISIVNGNIQYNTRSDSNSDILNTVYPIIYKSNFLGNVYYFGYKFRDNAGRHDRSTVIRWLKNLDSDGIDERSLRQFIRKPILELNSVEDLSTFDCIIYPRSNRSPLTFAINNELSKLSQHGTLKKSYELIKSLPGSVEFDWESFDFNYSGTIGDNQYNQIRNYIETELIPKIHNLSYFSIADNVKYKYRPYIKNYLTFADKPTEDTIKAIQNGKILIVDDINTSGSTLTEILRIIHKINNNCKIFIFTLIGKE